MDNPQTIPRPDTRPNRYSIARTVAAALVAAVISVALNLFGRRESWPYYDSIAFTVFLFLIPVLTPVADPTRALSRQARTGLGLVVALLFGFGHALLNAR